MIFIAYYTVSPLSVDLRCIAAIYLCCGLYCIPILAVFCYLVLLPTAHHWTTVVFLDG